jgi:predicted RNA-binding protein YlxR (DUF448 family)
MACKSKKVPIRTCLGCGKKAPKAGMLRFVWHKAQLHQDQKGLMNGRGVYACNDMSCMKVIVDNPKKMARVLRCPAIKAVSKPLPVKRT